MQELISKEVNDFTTEVINVINDMSIYSLKDNKKLDKAKQLFKTVGLDINILNDLINQKRHKMLMDLQALLDDYNLPITAKYENNNTIAFFFNENKIGRLGIYGGNFEVFNTSISRCYDEISIFFYTKGILLTKPKYNEDIKPKELSVYTSYKTLDISIGHLEREINTLKEKKQTFVTLKEKINCSNEKVHNLDGLSYSMFKKRWLEYFNALINSVDNDINNTKEFIKFLKTIKTDDNEYIDILVIKNALEDFLINELKLTN